jgi:hypothetical protein
MSVRFGDLALEAGRPAVAVSFTDADSAGDIAAARAAGVAIAELGVDLFADASIDIVVATARRLGGLPLLATIRMSEEGGAWTGGEAKRQALFEAVLPHVDAIDIELRAADTLAVLAPKAAAAGKALVVSHHDFAATPDPEELAVIARRAVAITLSIDESAKRSTRSSAMTTPAAFAAAISPALSASVKLTATAGLPGSSARPPNRTLIRASSGYRAAPPATFRRRLRAPGRRSPAG